MKPGQTAQPDAAPSAEQLNDVATLQADQAALLQQLPDYLQKLSELAKKMTEPDPTKRIDLASVQQALADLPRFTDVAAPAEAMLVDEEEQVA